MNADLVTPHAREVLMKHRYYETSAVHKPARQVNPAVQNVYVPSIPGVALAS